MAVDAAASGLYRPHAGARPSRPPYSRATSPCDRPSVMTAVMTRRPFDFGRLRRPGYSYVLGHAILIS